MIPIKPFSVKLPPEVRNRIKEAAHEVGYSENQFIVESVASVLDMIGQEGEEMLPRVVVLVRAARRHRTCPKDFQRKMRRNGAGKTPQCQA